jgi:hypothetical protein
MDRLVEKLDAPFQPTLRALLTAMEQIPSASELAKACELARARWLTNHEHMTLSVRAVRVMSAIKELAYALADYELVRRKQ